MEITFHQVVSITQQTLTGDASRTGWIELRIEEQDKPPVFITMFAAGSGQTPKIEEATE